MRPFEPRREQLVAFRRFGRRGTRRRNDCFERLEHDRRSSLTYPRRAKPFGGVHEARRAHQLADRLEGREQIGAKLGAEDDGAGAGQLRGELAQKPALPHSGRCDDQLEPS